MGKKGLNPTTNEYADRDYSGKRRHNGKNTRVQLSLSGVLLKGVNRWFWQIRWEFIPKCPGKGTLLLFGHCEDLGGSAGATGAHPGP